MPRLTMPIAPNGEPSKSTKRSTNNHACFYHIYAIVEKKFKNIEKFVSVPIISFNTVI